LDVGGAMELQIQRVGEVRLGGAVQLVFVGTIEMGVMAEDLDLGRAAKMGVGTLHMHT